MKKNNKLKIAAWLFCLVYASGFNGVNADEEGTYIINEDDTGGSYSPYTNSTTPPENAMTPAQLAAEDRLNIVVPDKSQFSNTTKVPTSETQLSLSTLDTSNSVTILGSVRNDRGQSLCAMVLANGEYMFSCDASLGTYSLEVPLDGAGEITLFGFADGHFPSRTTLAGAPGGRQDIILRRASSSSKPPSPPPNPTTPPPPSPPPSSTSTVTLSLTDGCNDGYYIEYKFYDKTNNLVWPSSSTLWYTRGYNLANTHNLSCRTGANICYGADLGNSYWGVGSDGTYGCTDCCIRCVDGAKLSRTLTCG